MVFCGLNKARSLLPLILSSSLVSTLPSAVSGAAFLSSSGPSKVSLPRTSLRHYRTTTSSRLAMSSVSPPASVIPGRPTWQQTMLRIRDPAKSLAFYRDLLGFTLIDTFDFPQYKFSLYFLTTLPQGETYTLTPGSQEAHDYLWSMEGVCLELTHNHGTEEGDFEGYHAGNQDRDGFGHIAVK